MNQEKKGLLSTKTLRDPQNYGTSDDLFPLAPTPNERTHGAVYSVIPANNKAYMYLIGRLPYFSSQENEYYLIEYHYDANTIVGVPLKNRQAVSITEPWKYFHEKF